MSFALATTVAERLIESAMSLQSASTPKLHNASLRYSTKQEKRNAMRRAKKTGTTLFWRTRKGRHTNATHDVTWTRLDVRRPLLFL